MPGRTAVLSHKIMTNMMYFEDISQMSAISYDKAKIKPFNSDQISLVKINNLNYYGNIDQVLSSRFKYPIGVGADKQFTSSLSFISTKPWNKDYTYGRGLLSSNDPVYMKYKSTPHAVVNLGVNPGSDSDSFNSYNAEGEMTSFFTKTVNALSKMIENYSRATMYGRAISGVKLMNGCEDDRINRSHKTQLYLPEANIMVFIMNL